MKKKINWKKELMDFSFLAPSLILFLFIILVPLVRGVQYTFTNWDGLMPKLNYVGLKNYITVIHDKDLIQPICNTILFTLVTVVAINVIGLAVAMAVNKEFKGVNIIKSIIFIPLVVSLVLVSQMWMYVYSDFFSLLGWKSPLIDKKTSMLGLCIMSIWRESGLAMMIYLAGLKNIPTEINEAAIIDGANFWQRFRNVTVPFLAPAFTYCIPLWLAAGLRMYDYSFVATSGGPQHSTETMAYYIYSYLFPYNKVGYGQTVAVLYLIVCIILSNVVTRTLRKREFEQ
ncbi:MAG: sugar ABC transporter permease [Lachnospiraceae bacterium]|jgi:raffinose/stachyose/melibiose transport system permease protein